MEFLRIGPRGQETPVVRVGNDHFDITPIGDIGPSFWPDGPQRVAQALDADELDSFTPADLRIGAPVSGVGSVICIGQNYVAHAAESGAAPPRQPIIFFKTPNTITGPYDRIGIPPGAETFDWEVELCIVIAKQASYLVDREEAAKVIGGYMIANDLSERDYQMNHSGGQWSKGKCIKDSMPVGPVLVTADSIDPHAIRLSSRVNGEIRQDSTTADMIFSVEEIVFHLSQYMQLEPGDVISTGTPQGVALSGRFPYLQPGDVSEIHGEGLGTQRQEYFRIEVRTGAGATAPDSDPMKGQS